MVNIGEGAGATISGNNNLIGDSGSIELPPDTIQDDPRLLPLADNGGATRTHALRPDSPAIDAGNNSASLNDDQRGPGFPRVLGTAADIGAFEGVDTDTIFANVYSEPHPLIDEQRTWLADYEASFEGDPS